MSALLAEQPVATADLAAALAWCAGIGVVAYLAAIRLYRRRIR
nr:hypothetical protein [Gordonia phthalatica]